ncbi:MFS transporter [Martelella alba]|uniref:MFS transporter n=1 Tax=Martelella alba TaxID=2590451 RepID=A0ABY2SK45_9HYPH|nr:MFS transporter [Martelella alba]TKI04493.1 MFS transporter [Martelella alba]
MSQFTSIPGRPFQFQTLLVLCAGMFMAILDVNVINIATVAIQSRFNASLSALTWAVDAYNLALSSLMLSAGVFTDRYGARRIWLLGLVVFTGMSVGCGLSGSMDLLIVLRLLQGSGAALFIPASFSLLSLIWPERAARQRAIGLFGGIVAIAAAMGPILGGFLVGCFGWRSLFLINFPMGCYGVMAGRRLLPRSAGGKRTGLDAAGQLLGIATLGGFSYVLIQFPSQEWSKSALPVVCLFSLLGAAAFIAAERRAVSPMLPLAFFRYRAFNLANITGFGINACYFGSLYALSLIMQQQWRYTPLQTGMALLPLAVCLMVGNLLAGRLMSRWGVKKQMVAGLAASALGYAAMLCLTPGITLYAIIAMALLAGGTAFVVPPMTATILAGSTAGTAGTASAIHTAIRQTGSLLGIALAGLTLSQAGSPLTLIMTVSALFHGGLALVIGVFLP